MIKVWLNIFASFCFISLLALFIGFRLMPAGTFVEYKGVEVIDTVIPRFQSTNRYKASLTVQYDDRIFCGDTNIAIPSARGFNKKRDWETKNWAAGVDLKKFYGQECQLFYVVTPLLFGIIEGQPEVGKTNKFILGK